MMSDGSGARAIDGYKPLNRNFFGGMNVSFRGFFASYTHSKNWVFFFGVVNSTKAIVVDFFFLNSLLRLNSTLAFYNYLNKDIILFLPYLYASMFSFFILLLNFN